LINIKVGQRQAAVFVDDRRQGLRLIAFDASRRMGRTHVAPRSVSTPAPSAGDFMDSSSARLAVDKYTAHDAGSTVEGGVGLKRRRLQMDRQAETRTDTGASRRIALPACPNCNDLLFAPAASEFVSKTRVRHFWSCDTCGHEFSTSVQLFFRRSDRPLS
jgi:RNase P subunit RPR2